MTACGFKFKIKVILILKKDMVKMKLMRIQVN